MKKLMIGLGVFFILLLALLTGAFFWTRNTLRKLSNDFQAAQSEVDAVNREFPFKAPADGRLTEAQLAGWIKVRGRLQQEDAQRFERIHKGGFQGVKAAMNMVPEVLKDSARIFREEKMSPDAYRWMTDQVMGALKSRAADQDPKTAELALLIGKPSPEIEAASRNRSGSRAEPPPQLQYAPLAAEDAQPILELLLKHEGEFRQVARISFADIFMTGLEKRQIRAVRSGKNAASDRITTATAEQAPASDWDRNPWTTATTH